MTFDDLPLLDYEKEVFAECGSWKNFYDLEDCLSLEELLELFDIATERQTRLAKIMAAAMGADVSDGSGTNGGGEDQDLVDASDAASLPFNIGYGSID